MNKVTDNIVKNQLKMAVLWASLMLASILVIIYLLLGDKYMGNWFLTLLLFLPCVTAVVFSYMLIRCIVLIIAPLRSDLFKKYGSPDEIAIILDEIEKTKKHEHKNLIISKKYICDKKDYTKIVACEDVLGIHKSINMASLGKKRFEIVITDKYGIQIVYSFSRKERVICDSLFAAIADRCKNAVPGYTEQAREYIKANKQKLPKNY